MPDYGGVTNNSSSSDFVSEEDDNIRNRRSEHANEFKILIQTTLSEESLGNLVGHSSDDDDEDDGSPGNSSRRCLVLLACTIVGFVMNVLVSVVAPFFPQEAKRLTHTNNTVIGFIFAIFPLTSLIVSPLINMSIRRLGRKSTLCLGLLTLSFSTLGFGLSKSIPLWCITRILQGAGSAAAGATYYAILSDMYPDTLGLIIGIQEAVTGLGYMVGPMLGAGLFALGGFRLPFLALGAFPLAVCLMLPPLLRNAHNFEPSHNIPGYGSPSLLAHQQQGSSSTDEEEEEEDAVSVEEQDRLHPPPLGGGGDKMMPPLSLNDMMHHQDLQDDQGRLKAAGGGSGGWCWSSSPYLSLPFVFVSLGTTLATCGFAFLEPVLSEHLMTQLHVSTSMSGLLMGVPSVTYIVAAPLGGWLGEVCGYRPILFLGFLIFAVGLALVGPMPLIPSDVDASLTWAIQVGALAMLGVGSAFGTITTMPDLKHIAGPGTTDDVACIFNNVLVPAGEVLGPLVGGLLTQLLGFRWAAFDFGCLLLLYGLLLLAMSFTGHMSWAHHREGAEEEEDTACLLERRLLRGAGHDQTTTTSSSSHGPSHHGGYSSMDVVANGHHLYRSLPEQGEDEEEGAAERLGQGQEQASAELPAREEEEGAAWGAARAKKPAPPQHHDYGSSRGGSTTGGDVKMPVVATARLAVVSVDTTTSSKKGGYGGAIQDQ